MEEMQHKRGALLRVLRDEDKRVEAYRGLVSQNEAGVRAKSERLACTIRKVSVCMICKPDVLHGVCLFVKHHKPLACHESACMPVKHPIMRKPIAAW